MKVIHKLLVLMFCSGSLLCQDLYDTDSIAFNVDINEFIVTAQYEPTHYKEAVHRVDIISREEIESRGAITLDQALVINPSIRVSYDQALGSKIRMRGIASNNVAVLIDGVPVVGRLDGAIDVSQINMQNVERIEVVEGALSNIYGSNAAGGVINVITKKSQIDEWKVRMNTQVESIGQQTYGTSLGYHKGKFSANVEGRVLNYNQYPADSLRLIELVQIGENQFSRQSKYPFNPKDQMGVGGYLRYNPDSESSVIFKYDYNHEEVKDYGVIKRIQFNPYAEDGFYNTVRSDYSLNYKKRWKSLFIDLTSAYNNYSRRVDDKRFYLETELFDSLLQVSDTTLFNTFFNRAVISQTINDDLTVIAGANYSLEKGNGDRIINRNSDDVTQAQFSEIAPYVEFKYSGIEGIDLSASARYTMHSAYDSKLTPALHVKYELADTWTVRASYAQGYRSPNLKELYLEFVDINHNILGNTALMPETSHDLQMTLDYNPSSSLGISLNAYHTTISDRIGLIQYETLKFRYDNIDEYKVFGFQPSVDYRVGSLSLSSSATIGYWDTLVENDSFSSFGKVVDVNNSISYLIGKGEYNLTLNHRHIGSQPNYTVFNDIVEVIEIQGYELIDISLSKALLNKKVNLTCGVRNLLGTVFTSVDTASGVDHSPRGRNAVSQGRNAYFTMVVNL